MSSLYQHPAQTRAQVIETAQEFGDGRQSDESGFRGAMSPPSGHSRTMSNSRRNNKRRGSLSRPRVAGRMNSGNVVPPAPGISEVLSPHAPSNSSAASASTAVADTPLLKHADHDHESAEDVREHLAKDANEAEQGVADGHSHEDGHGHGHGHGHGGHGHDHGSMNMRGVFLHVLGDAYVLSWGGSEPSLTQCCSLGNVGVIAAGLVIWL